MGVVCASLKPSWDYRLKLARLHVPVCINGSDLRFDLEQAYEADPSYARIMVGGDMHPVKRDLLDVLLPRIAADLPSALSQIEREWRGWRVATHGLDPVSMRPLDERFQAGEQAFLARNRAVRILRSEFGG